MPSTRDATTKLGPIRRAMLQSMLQAIDAFHDAQAKVADGIDPTTGGALPADGARAALDAATGRLTQALHAAIDKGWAEGAQNALTTIWGRTEAPQQTARVLESEIARQKAFASRFALDIARGETEERRKIPEPTRAAMYADAAGAAYNVGASLGAPDGALIWWRLGSTEHCWECPVISANSPYTRESLPTTPRAGTTPCRARCACFLEINPAQGVKFPTPEDVEKGRRFEDRVLNPPPVPPGLRLPTPEERGVMRDREIRLNFARRKAADAEAAGRKGEAKLWYQRRKEINAEAIAYAKERGIHDVPTFRVDDVIAGKDIGQRDIDRLTHFRGIDGVTVSRAQVAAIKEAAAAARADVLRVLGDYPASAGVGRDEWRRLLREAGAPASAFGGELTRLAREACAGCHHHEHDGTAIRSRPALGMVQAAEAAIPDVTVEVLPHPVDWQVVNIMSETARETLEAHALALEVLGAAGRRTGVAPYRVEVGPFGDGWEDLVAVGGTWVQGGAPEVARFCAALLKASDAPLAVAPWQPMG